MHKVLSALLLLIGVWLTSVPLAHAQPAPLCNTPRSAMMSLINALQPEAPTPEDARACFDFRRGQPTEAQKQEIARKLKAVLDARGLFVYEDRLPDDPDFKNAQGLRVFAPFDKEFPELVLHKVGSRWLFAPETIAQTPQVYAQTFTFGVDALAAKLPDVFQRRVLGANVWQWLALLLLIVVFTVISRVLERLILRALRRVLRQRNVTLVDTTERVARPLMLLLLSMMMVPVLPELGLPAKFSLVLLIALKVLATCAVVVILYRLVDILGGVMNDRASKTDSRLDDQLVPLVTKSLKAVVVIIALLFILQNLKVDVGSLLAGLGIGGLAFAFAAKDTLANFFGSLMIFVDRPFQIGDWVLVEGVEGAVEEVGFRSTRVRTFHQSLVTVPNSKVANSVIDNMGERQYRRLKLTLGLTYSSTPDQVQAYVEGLRAILRRNDAIWYEGTQVCFYNYGASALEIMVYTFLDVPDWSEELRHRHNLLLDMMRLAKAVGVSFAFPSQSLYLESTPDKQPAHSSPTREELVRIVEGFGPGGEEGEPDGDPLTGQFGAGDVVARGSGE